MKHLSFLKHKFPKLQYGERHPDFQLLKGKVAILEKKYSYAVKPLKHQISTILASLKSNMNLLATSTHNDSSSDNEQDFVSSILPGNRPNSTSIRRQLHQKSIMKKKAGLKANAKHKEQTVVDVTEQLGNCKLDTQEKAATCELPLQKVNTQEFFK